MKTFALLICCLVCIGISLPTASAKELWGYADKTGKVVIEPQFVYASSFSHGYAECYGYSCKTGEADRSNIIFVDKGGKRSVLPSNNYSRATSKTEIYDVFDIGGKKIIQDNSTVWSTRGNFKLVQGAYGVCVSDLRGHILKKLPQSWSNEETNPLTRNQWCSVGTKAYEFTGVTKSEVPGFEPTTRPPNFAAGFSYFDGFHEGLAAAMTKDGHWVYLDSKGKVAIKLPRDCSSAQAFCEGLAAVSVGGKPWKRGNHAPIEANNGAKFGFIDKAGSFVIPPEFPCPYTHWSNNLDAGSQFHGGIAIATAYKDGDVAFGYIDRNGKFVVPPIYRSIGPLSEGMIAINAQPVGFDKDEWMEQRPGNLNQLVYFRAEVFAKFLRQFELVGMQRSKVENLLGKPNGISEHNKVDFYTLSRMLKAEIKYTHEKVSGYRVAYWSDCADKWITSSVKPEPDEDLANFCSKNASR